MNIASCSISFRECWNTNPRNALLWKTHWHIHFSMRCQRPRDYRIRGQLVTPNSLTNDRTRFLDEARKGTDLPTGQTLHFQRHYCPTSSFWYHYFSWKHVSLVIATRLDDVWRGTNTDIKRLHMYIQISNIEIFMRLCSHYYRICNYTYGTTRRKSSSAVVPWNLD